MFYCVVVNLHTFICFFSEQIQIALNLMFDFTRLLYSTVYFQLLLIGVRSVKKLLSCTPLCTWPYPGLRTTDNSNESHPPAHLGTPSTLPAADVGSLHMLTLSLGYRQFGHPLWESLMVSLQADGDFWEIAKHRPSASQGHMLTLRIVPGDQVPGLVSIFPRDPSLTSNWL